MMGAADPIRALLDTPSPTRAADDWGRFVETLISLHAGRSGWPAELACARGWYEPHLERLHDDAITRRADLIQLEQIGMEVKPLGRYR
jgi:DNA helicase-2/ATP-dependent DNA helicase PcrA